MVKKEDGWNSKPKGEKHLLAEKLAKEEAVSNSKIYPNKPVDAGNNPIAEKNVWTVTHGTDGKLPLKSSKIGNVVYSIDGQQRGDAASLRKGSGPQHNVEGREFQVHNYTSDSPSKDGKNVSLVEKAKGKEYKPAKAKTASPLKPQGGSKSPSHSALAPASANKTAGAANTVSPLGKATAAKSAGDTSSGTSKTSGGTSSGGGKSGGGSSGGGKSSGSGKSR